MEKLKMQSPDKIDKSIEEIAKLFPHVITESKDQEGNITKAIDFNLLKQSLSSVLVEDDAERYRLDWPGKKASLLKANSPINKTLRPCREESVNFDTTENLYLEGDNFQVLKILQESYLNKVKMIYIDPPYNTGKDFVYTDNFRVAKEDYEEEIGLYDEEGGKLFRNTDTNGRFHSDWLSMMYERLIVARDLLKDDGVIFISIDDNEVHNLRKICDEVFGEENFVAILPTIMNLKGNNDQYAFAGTHEHTMVYTKKYSESKFYEYYIPKEELGDWKKDEYGIYKKGANLKATGINAPRSKRPNLFFPLYISEKNEISLKAKTGYQEIYPLTEGQEMSWRWSKEKFENELYNVIVSKSNGEFSIYKKQRNQNNLKPTKKPKSIFIKPEYSSGNGTQLLKNMFEGKIFDFPKPLLLIYDFLTIGSRNEDIILDFFSGSATTAHAVMQLNAEDGGKRKFIMVQLPEKTDEKSEAYKAGYETISDIGKERIRRAGKQIMDELRAERDKLDEKMFAEDKLKEIQGKLDNLDIGFRVYKTDSSNMKDVYYHPNDYEQMTVEDLISNTKEDRSPEDLLTQVILDLGLELNLPIEKQRIKKNDVFFVLHNSLVACFDDELDFDIVDEIAKVKPLRVVFKDASFRDDKDRINLESRFKRLSPDTLIKVL